MNAETKTSSSQPIFSVEASGYRTLQDIVYAKLRDDILSGKLAPDTPLNTNELSRQTNISRTPIREAINKLESIGLVQKINHREAKVASFITDEIHEIFYLRSSLEGLAARMACSNLDAGSKQRLVELAEEGAICIHEESDDHFLKINDEFHHLIYNSIKTPIIRDVINQFYTITLRYRRIGYDIAGRREQVTEEHRKLANYILIGDAENAEAVGRQHHLNTINLIEGQFKK